MVGSEQKYPELTRIHCVHKSSESACNSHVFVDIANARYWLSGPSDSLVPLCPALADKVANSLGRLSIQRQSRPEPGISHY